MNVLGKVRQITAEDHEISVDQVTPETDFFADLGDSLNFVETIMACEEAFGIAIPDEDVENQQLTTVGRLAAYVEARLQNRSNAS